jgi:hypothetical protein
MTNCVGPIYTCKRHSWLFRVLRILFRLDNSKFPGGQKQSGLVAEFYPEYARKARQEHARCANDEAAFMRGEAEIFET